ncbi:hypothetical protein LBSG162_14590 [Lentilactobacillus buchneri subsp. silagei]|nr:hypothetical protein LBSG162_14590 [Lentilactobacillus buchneri subsp. silagei]GED95781.1 hypothetical protein LBSP_23410 [Lentilactobacillus buchneri subsp. silagei]
MANLAHTIDKDAFSKALQRAQINFENRLFQCFDIIFMPILLYITNRGGDDNALFFDVAD